jgi:hypothetical protein
MKGVVPNHRIQIKYQYPSAEITVEKAIKEPITFILDDNPSYAIGSQKVLLTETKSLVDDLNKMPPDIESNVSGLKDGIKTILLTVMEDFSKNGIYSLENLILIEDIFSGVSNYGEKVARYAEGKCINGNNGECRFSIKALKRLGGLERLPALNAKREFNKFHRTFAPIIESDEYRTFKENYVPEKPEKRYWWDTPALKSIL